MKCRVRLSILAIALTSFEGVQAEVPLHCDISTPTLVSTASISSRLLCETEYAANKCAETKASLTEYERYKVIDCSLEPEPLTPSAIMVACLAGAGEMARETLQGIVNIPQLPAQISAQLELVGQEFATCETSRAYREQMFRPVAMLMDDFDMNRFTDPAQSDCVSARHYLWDVLARTRMSLANKQLGAVDYPDDPAYKFSAEERAFIEYQMLTSEPNFLAQIAEAVRGIVVCYSTQAKAQLICQAVLGVATGSVAGVATTSVMGKLMATVEKLRKAGTKVRDSGPSLRVTFRPNAFGEVAEKWFIEVFTPNDDWTLIKSHGGVPVLRLLNEESGASIVLAKDERGRVTLKKEERTAVLEALRDGKSFYQTSSLAVLEKAGADLAKLSTDNITENVLTPFGYVERAGERIDAVRVFFNSQGRKIEIPVLGPDGRTIRLTPEEQALFQKSLVEGGSYTHPLVAQMRTLDENAVLELIRSRAVFGADRTSGFLLRNAGLMGYRASSLSPGLIEMIHEKTGKPIYLRTPIGALSPEENDRLLKAFREGGVYIHPSLVGELGAKMISGLDAKLGIPVKFADTGDALGLGGEGGIDLSPRLIPLPESTRVAILTHEIVHTTTNRKLDAPGGTTTKAIGGGIEFKPPGGQTWGFGTPSYDRRFRADELEARIKQIAMSAKLGEDYSKTRASLLRFADTQSKAIQDVLAQLPSDASIVRIPGGYQVTTLAGILKVPIAKSAGSIADPKAYVTEVLIERLRVIEKYKAGLDHRERKAAESKQTLE